MILMKCLFEQSKDCIRIGGGHDDCRRCKRVPDFENNDTEERYLCAIAGKRESQKEYYGIINGKDPKWLTDLLKKYHGIMGIENCFDHRRTLKTLVISEPYDLDMDDFRKLIQFCDDNNLHFSVDGSSAWFPGKTFRVLLSTKKTNVRIGAIK